MDGSRPRGHDDEAVPGVQSSAAACQRHRGVAEALKVGHPHQAGRATRVNLGKQDGLRGWRGPGIRVQRRGVVSAHSVGTAH